MSAARTWTIGDVLGWTAERFEREQLDSPRLDAEVLLADLLGVERITLYVDYAKPLQPHELAAYRARVKRRLTREPVAYITGHREFWSLRFAVDEAVLIPRPDTELLVELALAELSRRADAGEASVRVVDVGTGSGAIAVAVAHAAAAADLSLEVAMHASDISPDALAVARRNAADHGVEPAFAEGDLLDAFPGETFDLLLSNPPYIASGELAELMPDVVRFEPRGALDGGDDGLDVLERLLAQAAERLTAGGLCLVEIGHDQGEQAKRLAEAAGLREAVVHPDLAGRDRVLAASAPRLR